MAGSQTFPNDRLPGRRGRLCSRGVGFRSIQEHVRGRLRRDKVRNSPLAHIFEYKSEHFYVDKVGYKTAVQYFLFKHHSKLSDDFENVVTHSFLNLLAIFLRFD